MQARPVGTSLLGRPCGEWEHRSVEHDEQEIRSQQGVDKAQPTAKQKSYLRYLRR